MLISQTNDANESLTEAASTHPFATFYQKS